MDDTTEWLMEAILCLTFLLADLPWGVGVTSQKRKRIVCLEGIMVGGSNTTLEVEAHTRSVGRERAKSALTGTGSTWVWVTIWPIWTWVRLVHDSLSLNKYNSSCTWERTVQVGFSIANKVEISTSLYLGRMAKVLDLRQQSARLSWFGNQWRNMKV